jgi:UV DNA damage repair endonuclease
MVAMLRSVNNNDEVYTMEELLDMCEQVHTCFEIKRNECKELCKKVNLLSNPLMSSMPLMRG